MIKHILPLIGLIIFTYSTQAQISSDSGSGSFIDIDGSGFGDVDKNPVVSSGGGNSIILPDDEDEPVIISVPEGSGAPEERKTVTETIDIVEGSGVGELKECFWVGEQCKCMSLSDSGSYADSDPSNCGPLSSSTTRPTTTTKAPTTTPVVLPERMVCSSSGLYCWCVDFEGEEMAGTRLYMYGTKLSPYVSCPLPTQADTTTTTTTTRKIEVTSPLTDAADITLVEEKTTMKYEPPPFVVNVNDGDIKEKTDKPPMPAPGDDKDDEIGEGAGKGNRNGGVDREDVNPAGGALFTHPGILAAIIGGGVVALLSFMLLVMFIVYRMRKKDEGSYPLDPDSKPPRLHTYTRAPNKEFYA